LLALKHQLPRAFFYNLLLLHKQAAFLHLSACVDEECGLWLVFVSLFPLLLTQPTTFGSFLLIILQYKLVWPKNPEYTKCLTTHICNLCV
jgi:hypothetical protein